MSAKIENSKINEDDNNQNDWDLDDDSWDDWGDAEENTTTEQTQMPTASSQQQKEEVPANNNSQNVQGKGQEKKVENNNFEKSSAEPNKTTSTTQGGGGGWGSLFGGVMSSVLSTATELTTTVSHGLDKVIGVPDPEEMARINALHEARQKVQQEQEKLSKSDQEVVDNEERSLTPTRTGPAFGLSLVNNVTTLGSKVLNTGLDTLEGIGKKTMTILQENDPMIKNKIKKLGLEKEKVNITELLKEAKRETEQLEQSMRELNMEKMKAQLRFEVLFENNCGLVHLEALEILSKESQLKIQTLKDSVSGKALDELLETLNEVKELMDLEDLECESESEDYEAKELDEKLKQAIEDTELQINFDEIVSLWSSSLTWFNSEESKDPEVQPLFAKAMITLSETCALEILKLHKIAELLLIKDHHSTANEVDGIVQLCKQFIMHLQVVANRFAGHLTKHEQQEEAKSHISTIFAEMLEARQQIEKAFKLFLPILQIGAV
ncbi:protein FAM114A2 [Stomoxys calcitrans]|uniref:protein FAM114A2 n=1 Tax=Stomoxys calcitrans TaxID=35570 RepID=UPI0027E25B4D|nr:protein FAM114A2 [Stomoxys calcitrans]